MIKGLRKLITFWFFSFIIEKAIANINKLKQNPAHNLKVKIKVTVRV